jgi:hypothetical protein
MHVNTNAAAAAVTATSCTSIQRIQFHRAVLALTKLFTPLSYVQIFLSRKNLKARKTVKISKSP